MSLHDCDVRFCLKKKNIFILSFSANVTYSFRNPVYLFTYIYFSNIRWCKRYRWNLSSDAQRADRGCRLYHIFISFYWKSRSNEKSLSEKSQIVWARFWDITSQRQKETYSKKASTIRRRGGKLYEWRYRRKVIWFHANRPPFFRPTTNFTSTLSLNNA